MRLLQMSALVTPFRTPSWLIACSAGMAPSQLMEVLAQMKVLGLLVVVLIQLR